jgi:tripartite-type tricarboxylate transporter receptor subunit TctC
MRSSSFGVVPLFLAASLFAGSAWGDDYPSRPIHLVVPAPAGGGSDIYGRLLASRLAPILGQPVVVENRAGAAGRIAYEHVAKSKPDGYTLIIATSAILLQKLMYQSLPYDPVKDFAPIARVARNQQILVIPASLPATDLRSFVALVKAHPGEHNYAHSGVGNPPHLAAELLCAMAGLDMVGVQYTGDATALVDLLAGRVSMFFGSIAPAVPHVNSGKLRALAVSGPTRSPAVPDVPTMAEAGVPGYAVSGWFGLLAPAGTPASIVQRLNDAVVKVMAMPDVQKTFLDSGIEPGSSSVEEFARNIDNLLEVFAKNMKVAHIEPQP